MWNISRSSLFFQIRKRGQYHLDQILRYILVIVHCQKCFWPLFINNQHCGLKEYDRDLSLRLNSIMDSRLIGYWFSEMRGMMILILLYLIRKEKEIEYNCKWWQIINWFLDISYEHIHLQKTISQSYFILFLFSRHA